MISIETQTTEVREAQTAKTKGEKHDEMQDRRQRDKEEQVSPIYPWDHKCKQPERLRNSLFMKHPPGEIINLQELISPFLTKKYKESRRIW